MKKKIIKILSLVFVLVTISISFVVPSSAAMLRYSDMSDVIAFNEKFSNNNVLHYYCPNQLTVNYKNSQDRFTLGSVYNFLYDTSFSNDCMFTIYNIPDTAIPTNNAFNMLSYKFSPFTKLNELEWSVGDTITFNFTILAPICEGLTFSYSNNGEDYSVAFDKSNLFYTTNKNIVMYSGSPTVYGDTRVAVHEYTLTYTYRFTQMDIDYGNTAPVFWITQDYYYGNNHHKTFLYFKDCGISYINAIEKTNNNGYTDFEIESMTFWEKVVFFFKNISTWFSNIFKELSEFFLNFGSNIKSIFGPFFNNIGTWFSNLWTNISSGFTNLGNTIGGFFSNIGQSFYNFFADSFLGDIFSIRDNFKNLGSRIGQPQVLTLSDDLEETVSEVDIMQNSVFFVDIDYYSSLYDNPLV